MQPYEVIDKQLEFYNQHNLDGFASMYSPDIRIFNWGMSEAHISGLDNLREVYTKRFTDQNLLAKINNRITIGNKVIDEEIVKSSTQDYLKVIVIYEVANDKIQKVTFIRE